MRLGGVQWRCGGAVRQQLVSLVQQVNDDHDPALVFTSYGWETYSSWLARDRTIVKAANKLITAILTDPFAGIGKPEPLEHQLAENWSRRIAREHRLIYRVADTEIVIIGVGGHTKSEGGECDS